MDENKRSLFLLNEADKWDILEEAFSLPVSERTAFIIQKMKEKKAFYLGDTDKSGPELATEFIKKGIKAQSVGNTIKKGASNA